MRAGGCVPTVVRQHGEATSRPLHCRCCGLAQLHARKLIHTQSHVALHARISPYMQIIAEKDAFSLLAGSCGANLRCVSCFVYLYSIRARGEYLFVRQLLSV